jgi:hypothetical protein
MMKGGWGLKIKAITTFALIIIIGVCILPFSALAETPDGSPAVEAAIIGTTLRVEVADGDHEVEAVYINDIRFNNREDGVLKFHVLDFADYGETVEVYAVDIEGNMSNVVTLAVPTPPPIFNADTPPPPPQESIPLTPRGQATVLDHATDEDGKEFFTFVTPAGNVFFLIVDHQRSSDNVYFLNAVTEADLIALAEAEGLTIEMPESAIPITQPNNPIENEPDMDEAEDEKEAEKPIASGGISGTLIFVLLGVVALGGAGYYIKIVRPKKQSRDYDDEYGEGGGDDDTGDMEFEDEQDEDDGDYEDDEDGDK